MTQEIQDYVSDFIIDDISIFDGCTSFKSFLEIATQQLDNNLWDNFNVQGSDLPQDIQDEFIDGIKEEWKIFKKCYQTIR